MAWLMLLVAGTLEVGWAVGLNTQKDSQSFGRRLKRSGRCREHYATRSRSENLAVGTSYAVWVGIGALGTAIFGIAFLGEPATATRLASLALIVAGVIGLKLSAA